MFTKLELRKEAMRLYYYQHLQKSDICRQLNCSRPWLDRWLQGYDPDHVDESLRNHPRGSHHVCMGWSDEIRHQVLEMRRERSQRDKWPYALIGAAAIHYELKALNAPEVPPIRTIHYWLVQADLVKPKVAEVEPGEAKPIPLPKASHVNAVQQLDLKGPIYLHGLSHKYYLSVLRDCYTHRCALDVLENRQAQSIVNFLITSWQWLGLPEYLQMDNALEFRGSNRYPRSFGRVVRVAVDLKVEPVFNPPSEPWRNGGIERYNGFLQDRLLSIECADYLALKQQAYQCQNACNQTHRPASLNGQTPNEIASKATLRLPPKEYEKHQQASLSQDKGFVSFVRLIRKSGRITLGAKDRFMVNPDLAYTYVLAKVNLKEKIVVISQEGITLKIYDFSPNTLGAWADDDKEQNVEN